MYAFIRILSVAALSFGMAIGTAAAKEPFGLIQSLTGVKRIHGIVNVQSKTVTATKIETLSLEGEFIYLGGNDLWFVTQEGVTEVDMLGLGSGHFQWTDADGRTFDLLINDGDTLPFGGLLLQGDAVVGKFRVGKSQAKTDPASGQWSGVLAFPGGTFLDTSLVVSGIPDEWDEECNGGNLPARITFPGHTYQGASLTHCDEQFMQGHDYGLGTLFVDSVTGDVWFLAIDVSLTVFGNLEGSAFAMPITNPGNVHWGIAALSRPAAFSL